MIISINEENLDFLIDNIKDRNINFLKIVEKDKSYYAEYEVGLNQSDKMIDLLLELETFKKCYLEGTVSHFYLWYNVAVDRIISNTQTIESENKRASNREVIDMLNDVKLLLLSKDKKKKITFTDNRKKLCVSVENVIDELVKKLS